MASMNDVDTNKLIDQVAEKLKENPKIQAPSWASFAKTGVFKERAPSDSDWWYKRSAAVLRSVRLIGPVGTEKLRTRYGGRKNRGHAPDRFCRGSGSVIRKVLQQLEAGGLIIKAEKGAHKGRVVTPAGMSLLDKTAIEIKNANSKTPQ